MTEYPNHQPLIAELKRYKTKLALLDAPAFQKHHDYLSELLLTPREFPVLGAKPRLRDFLRVVHWNIEKGKYLDEVIGAFQQHPILQHADLISINEADVGMNRSGQRFVAKELGAALGMHTVFAPCYLEFSKGYGDDLRIPGQNTVALQGNAILSRYELLHPRVIQLPLCYDHFEHVEKRIGNRNALAVELEIRGKHYCFVSTHLEVRNGPECRAQQIANIVAHLERAGTPRSVLIAGDFNSNTFARGGMLTTMQGLFRLMFSRASALRQSIKSPQKREPLFAYAKKHGFTDVEFNSDDVTCYVPMNILEDSNKLPKILAALIQRQMNKYGGQLDFRLDWMLGRGIAPLRQNEVSDGATGIASAAPLTIKGLRNRHGGQITDHDPIVVDIRID